MIRLTVAEAVGVRSYVATTVVRTVPQGIAEAVIAAQVGAAEA
jgi:hypothetical protein